MRIFQSVVNGMSAVRDSSRTSAYDSAASRARSASGESVSDVVMPPSYLKRYGDVKPHPVRDTGYREQVPASDPTTYLWENICALMGAENPSIDAVTARVKVGRGTVQRIKEGATATRLDILHTIAEALGVEVWQLLVPGASRANLPTLATDRESLASRLDSIEQRIEQLALSKTLPRTGTQ